MIALAATDMEERNVDMDTSEDSQLSVSATLIIVPPPRKFPWPSWDQDLMHRSGRDMGRATIRVSINISSSQLMLTAE